MRRIALFTLGLLVVAFAAWGGIGLADDPATKTATPKTLDVTGRGTIEVSPDTAIITVGVNHVAETPSDAYKETSKSMKLIADSLKLMGVQADDIKTTELNLHAEYNWTQERGQVLKGYRASSSLRVSTQKLDQVGALVEAAVAAGANQLHSIQFTVKDQEKLMQTAMDLAVDNAMDKANRVSRRMGTTVVSVLRVSVHDSSSNVVRQVIEAAPMSKGAGMDMAMPVYGGTAAYTVTVTATFEIK